MILSKNFQDTIYQSIIFAINQFNHQYLTPEHILFCALDDKNILGLMENQMIDIKRIRNKLFDHLSYDLNDLANKNTDENNKESKNFSLKFTNNLVILIERAIIHCCENKTGLISILDFILEIMLDYDSFGGFILRTAHLSPTDIVRYKNYLEEISNLKNNKNINSQNTRKPINYNNISEKPYDFMIGDNFNNGMNFENQFNDNQNKKNSFLEQFCINFNVKALQNKIDNVINREKELDLIIKSLCCRRKGNCLLVGDSGVGKTAIVEYLAQKIINEKNDIPKKFKNSIIYSLDLNSLISGTRYRGDLEERLKNIMQEIESAKQPIILFIDEIHTVIGTGSTNNGTLDIGNILKPYLARGLIYCIGATTRKEHSLYLSKDKAFLRRFQIIFVNEPNEGDACKMISGIIKNYEKFHNVKYSKGSIETAVKLSKRYIFERQLPDVALDVIDFAGSIASINKSIDGKTVSIDSRDIENVVISLANLPNKRICGNEMKRLSSLAHDLKLKIIGQNEAINQVCSSIIVSKSGLNNENPNKPMASFMFYGPTGVGKTELAIQLAKLMSMNLMRIDMSEYSEAHSISKLFGSPPGYVGFDQSGFLSEEIIKNPYTIILFDEIEKSHPTIHSSLLQILDYGSITDSFGRKINFSNTIIICTTNTASKAMDKITPGFGSIENKLIVERELEEMFSPEFRNRFSSIIRFNHLEKDTIKQIIETELDKIKNLFMKKNIDFSISNDVISFIMEKGYNRGMGARPIDRVINSEIKFKLANIFMQYSINSNNNNKNNNDGKKKKKPVIKLLLGNDQILVKEE